MADAIGWYQRARYGAEGKANEGMTISDLVTHFGCSEGAVRTALADVQRGPRCLIAAPQPRLGAPGRPSIAYTFEQGHLWQGYSKPLANVVLVGSKTTHVVVSDALPVGVSTKRAETHAEVKARFADARKNYGKREFCAHLASLRCDDFCSGADVPAGQTGDNPT
jgi:hypothetical protein